MRGDQTGAEKIFNGGRGCANLRRNVPGRDRGIYESQIRWLYLAHIISGTEGTEGSNWRFA